MVKIKFNCKDSSLKTIKVKLTTLKTIKTDLPKLCSHLISMKFQKRDTVTPVWLQVKSVILRLLLKYYTKELMLKNLSQGLI